ncbi:hypothetical protein M885DRAFT_507121 [Pelagophyceae sp. CCMP2097]|nr:hypothetical protein M885DRAFT_507121 [Pelagophyceae sp. CCMP2097]
MYCASAAPASRALPMVVNGFPYSIHSSPSANAALPRPPPATAESCFAPKLWASSCASEAS